MCLGRVLGDLVLGRDGHSDFCRRFLSLPRSGSEGELERFLVEIRDGVGEGLFLL